MQGMWFPSHLNDLHVILNVIFHQHFSRHKLCDFDQVVSLSHHLKFICNHWSIVQSNFWRWNPTRRWRLTWEIVIFLDTTVFYVCTLPETVFCKLLLLHLSEFVDFAFTLRKRILSFPRSCFSSTPTSWQVFYVSTFPHPLQKFLDYSTVDACHILYFKTRKTFIWQI